MAEEHAAVPPPSTSRERPRTFSASCFAAVGVCVWVACTGGLSLWVGFLGVMPDKTIVLVAALLAVVPAAWVGMATAAGRRRESWLFLGVLLIVTPVVLIGTLRLRDDDGDQSSLRVYRSTDDYMFTSDYPMAPGTIVAFLGSLPEAPAGWMFLDGRSMSRAEYEALGRWGATPAAGDADTRQLPDYRGMLLGWRPGQGQTIHGNARLGPVPEWEREAFARAPHEHSWLELHWLVKVP